MRKQNASKAEKNPTEETNRQLCLPSDCTISFNKSRKLREKTRRHKSSIRVRTARIIGDVNKHEGHFNTFAICLGRDDTGRAWWQFPPVLYAKESGRGEWEEGAGIEKKKITDVSNEEE